MKTTFLCAFAVLAAVLLAGATVWEGVTDAAFAKDLPRAYSVATNSFPRNTVVDITNLENGKMVRVIVISGLEATGLLATLSRSAADAIGLRHDSTCRIRMTQTPVNASQYARAGAPPPVLQLGPIDASGAAVSAAESAPAANNAPPASKPVANNAPPAAKPAATTTTETVTATTRTTATESAPVASGAPQANSAPVTAQPPAAESAPAAAASRPAASVTAVDDIATADKLPAIDNIIAADKPPVTDNAIAANEPAVTNNAIAADKPSVTDNIIAADKPPVTDNIIAANEPAVTNNAIAADKPAVTDNIIAADKPPMTDNAVAAVPAEAATENQSEPRIASGTLTLIPADERLPPAQEQRPAVSGAAAPRNVAPNAAAPNAAPGVAPNVAPNNAPPPVSRTVETPAAYAPPAEFSPFQAPLINNLEKGKWYVQLGVYSRPDNVEDEISRIGPAYPVAIQNIGTDTSPMFRVLLGPLNQGESGAMLQRFKSIGYADAFVRHN